MTSSWGDASESVTSRASKGDPAHLGPAERRAVFGSVDARVGDDDRDGKRRAEHLEDPARRRAGGRREIVAPVFRDEQRRGGRTEPDRSLRDSRGGESESAGRGLRGSLPRSGRVGLPDPRAHARVRAKKQDPRGLDGIGRDGRHARLLQPVRGGEGRALVVRSEDPFAEGSEQQAAVDRIDLEGGHVERLPRNPLPALAAVVRAVEASDRARVQNVRVARVQMHDRGPPVRESRRIAGPPVAAVFGEVDPAARRDPEPARVVRVEIERIHRRVEDHSRRDPRPRFPQIPRSKRLAVGAGIKRRRVGRIERERLHEGEAGDSGPGGRPALPAVAREEDAVVAATGEKFRVRARLREGSRVDRPLPAREHAPGRAAVGRNGQERARPGSGERGPESSGRLHVGREGRDHVSGELIAGARRLPAAAPVFGTINVSARGPAEDSALFEGIDDDRSHVGAADGYPEPGGPEEGGDREKSNR